MSATKKLINELLQDLEDTWDMESEQLNDVREKLLVFGKAISSDEKLMREIQLITHEL
jgi:hypothetical protein